MLATETEEKPAHLGASPPRVSVVVPSYNHAQFVGMTLRSIFKQQLQPSMLLVIDDGSTDGSVAEIDAALQECPFPCDLIARENRGLSATLNEAFARTSGDYFAYLGSDDLWLPEFLAARVGLLQLRDDAVLAYGHVYFVDEDNQIIDCTADWANYADGDVREMLLSTIGPMSPSVVYRRAALGSKPWNEASKLEDYELYLRLAADEFAFDPRVLSAWRRHAANVSWDQTLMLEEQLQAQRQAALRFGFTEKQVEDLQRKTRFTRAEDFLRVGRKKAALELMTNNFGGATSIAATARIFARLLIPNSFMRGRMRARRRKAHERYGSIRV